MKILQSLKSTVKQALIIPIDSVPVASHGIGKCTTCKFNDKEYDCCVAGSYWAEKGLNRICYEGELWEAAEP